MSVSIPSRETPLAQPKFMSAFRRFGRYDEFKPLNTSTSSLGSKSIGKVNVDCQFLFQQCKWGTLHGHPGGIIHLNLNFGPPSGCRVSHVTVTITLDGDDPCLRPYKARRPREEPHLSNTSIGMTDWYGPKCMGGEKKAAEYTSAMKATPETNVLSYGFGGMGYEKTKNFKYEARWSFSGQLLRTGRTPGYKSLRWDLDENELEYQSFHNPKFRTAFAFEHSGQPFVIKVKIKGKLAKWHHQIKSKFNFDGAKEGKVVTLVDFEDHRKFSQGLDKIAEGLPLAMEMENLVRIPIEIPDSMPGTTFQQVPPGTPLRPSDPSVEAPVVNQAVGTGQQPLGSNSSRPVLQSTEQISQNGGCERDTRHGERPLHGVDDFIRILDALSHRTIQRPLGNDAPYTTASNTRNLVGVGNASEDLNRAQAASAPTASSGDLAETPRRRTNKPSSEVEHDAMLRILSIPGMLVILQFLASIMGKWGSDTSSNGSTLAERIHQGGANSQETTAGPRTKIESRRARVEETPEQS
ncbi:hypothetical protein LA080_007316 [Diaporthe eres]|nr:hypothetical protein LA080_007316 [Diaporthe eres]